MSPLDAGEGMRKTKCDYEGYNVLGSGGGNIGKVGCLFKDEDNQSEYVEVKGGLVERFLGHGYYILHGTLHGGRGPTDHPCLRGRGHREALPVPG